MSYANVIQADAYFATRIHTDAWDDSTDAEKTKALAHATSIIDTLNYQGSKAVEDQANEFPRFEDTEVPAAILYACAEIAKALLDGIDPESELADIGIVNQGYSSVRSSSNTEIPKEHILAGVPSAVGWRYLKPFLRDGSTFRISRVS